MWRLTIYSGEDKFTFPLMSYTDAFIIRDAIMNHCWPRVSTSLTQVPQEASNDEGGGVNL
jgi:hypothetical protein